MKEIDMEFHPMCLIFPQADERTLEEMADDILKNGLNDPIVRHEGKILDGRNRYLACLKAGVEPTYADYRGDEPLEYVVTKNLHRRHMNPSQLSMAAQKVYQLLQENENIPPEEKQTQKEIAEQFNVSPRNVRNAARVADVAAPEVVEQIKGGNLSVNAAVAALEQAKANAGISVTKKMTPAEKEALQAEQKRILQATEGQKQKAQREKAMEALKPKAKRDANEVAEEFNQQVLDGVYDGKRLRKNMARIQDILTDFARLPGLFNDSTDLVSTLEQEASLNMMLGMTLNDIRKLKGGFVDPSIDKKKLQQIVQKFVTSKFDPGEIERTEEGKELDALRARLDSVCQTVAENVTALRKKLFGKSIKNSDPEEGEENEDK